jgi:hypothetical protein
VEQRSAKSGHGPLCRFFTPFRVARSFWGLERVVHRCLAKMGKVKCFMRRDSMEVITDGIGVLLGSNIAFDGTDRQTAADALAEHVFLKPLLGYGFRFGYYVLPSAGMSLYRVYLVFPADIADIHDAKYEAIGGDLDAFLFSPEVVAFLDAGKCFALIDTAANRMPTGSFIEWAGALYLFWTTEKRSFGQDTSPVPFPPYHQPASLFTYNALEEASIEHHVGREKSVAYWQVTLESFEKGALLANMCSDVFQLFTLAMALPLCERKTKILSEFWVRVQSMQAPHS